jgi:hypothetical protein
MSFDRAKIIAEGGKYHGPDDMLVECAPFTATAISWEPVSSLGPAPSTIKEDANLPKRMMIEGVFQRFMPPGADANKYRNANKRVYTMERVGKKVLDPNGDVQKRIAERAMIGHLEHPADGTTDLNKGAILVTKVWAEADGTVKGRAMIYNTPEGQRIQEYVTTGTKIGISSRGTGTVDANGFVCEDFGLETWDMVYNPSTSGANPTLATESAETAVQNQQVLESSSPTGTTQSQDKPMNVAERIAQVREQASRLLAADPKRLTVEQRKGLAAELLNLRVQVAEEFAGEKRMVAEAVLKSLDEARAAVESTMSDTTGGFGGGAAPEGQTDGTGIPGGTFDILNRAVATAGAARESAVKGIQAMADLIAKNLGKLPEIQVAAEGVVAEKKTETPAAAPEAKPAADTMSESVRNALTEARDELIKLTERDEAASAIIHELTERLAKATADVERLVSETATLKAEAEKTAEVIANLTSAKNAAKVAESKVAAPAATAADPAPRKPLHERLVKPQPRTEGSEALPPKGKVVESAKDAGQGSPKPNITESSGSKGAGVAAAALRKLNLDG